MEREDGVKLFGLLEVFWSVRFILFFFIIFVFREAKKCIKLHENYLRKASRML